MARSTPFSFTTIPMISTSSGGSRCISTCSESAIWGTALGETNDTASMCLKPAFTSARRYAAFWSAGMSPFSPCHASRGHSTILTAFTTLPVSPCLCGGPSRLQHSHLELSHLRVERGGVQRFDQRGARVQRIHDFVNPQPRGAVARVGLLVVGLLHRRVQLTFLLITQLFPAAFQLLQLD